MDGKKEVEDRFQRVVASRLIRFEDELRKSRLPWKLVCISLALSDACKRAITSYTHTRPQNSRVGRWLDRRAEFCLWVIDNQNRNEAVHHTIVFSNEAVFHVNGMVNSHNLHFGATENPHMQIEKLQDRHSVTIYIQQELVF